MWKTKMITTTILNSTADKLKVLINNMQAWLTQNLKKEKWHETIIKNVKKLKIPV